MKIWINEVLKPNTLEINVPNGVESIVLDFSKSNKLVKTCEKCDKLNEVCLSSLPKWPVTGEYHSLGYVCDCNEESRRNTTYYIWLIDESGSEHNTLCCDNCGHQYVLHKGSKVPKFCEECGYKIKW